MTLEQAVSSAEFILIEGDRGTGKNMLSLFWSKSAEIENSITLVLIPEETYHKKTEISRKMMENCPFGFQHIFLLSDDWKLGKRQSGLHFILNDIEKMLDQTGAKLLYIQRIDLLFDMMDQLNSFEILSDIARLLLSRKVKTIVSLLKPSDNYHSIHDALLNYADLTLALSHDNDQRGRQLQVVSSFYPIETTLYRFVYTDSHFQIYEHSVESTNPVVSMQPAPSYTLPLQSTTINAKPKEVYNLAFIGQNTPLSEWNDYLFGSLSRFSLRRFRDLLEIDQEAIAQNDLLIYCSDSMEKLFDFFRTIQSHSQVKGIGILTNGYIRAEDKVQGHHLGASELFGKNIRLVDYVLGVEKTLGESAYSNTIQKHLQATLISSSDSFVDLIESSLRMRRIFTVFTFSYTVPFQNEPLETVFREEDIAYLDEEHHKIYLLFINAQKDDYHVLWKKILSIKNDIVFESAFEAPELFSGKELILEHAFGRE